MAKILFVCKQNAGRSQMSDALFQRAANSQHQSRSAGTWPAEHVHPVVADAMREIGIDISGNRPQKLTDDLAQWADVVVTMGCGDECPYIPGKRYIDWDLADPADQPLDAVRKTRDEIGRRVRDLSVMLDQR
jgi:arsenate reductase